ncbi:hypothetical protein QOZ80_2BG0177370 [Eleusine coracana subsp. coracana]|nr:hypothetical protein QOZ80_2BG0177370 [Eleusine coracana subsp. coracana]
MRWGCSHASSLDECSVGRNGAMMAGGCCDKAMDPRTESRVPIGQQVYLPCDERVGEPVVPAPNLPNPDGHFKSFAEIYSLFGLNELGQHNQAKGKFPVPQVISVKPKNWRTDKEFARQMLAGANPQDNQRSHREEYEWHDRRTEAVKDGKLYAVDHHDFMMPFLKRINELPGEEEKGEISEGKTLPHPEDEQLGAVSTVYTPPDTGDEDIVAEWFTIWDLAKAHATVNDTCKNNFVYHWRNVNATMEPLAIATNRQLTVLHPIHKLLKPHFCKTLYINSTARQILFGSGDRRESGEIFRGIQEVIYLPSKYGLEMASQAYKNWIFTDLPLPKDLINRGLAKGDPKNPEKLELLIKDYPFAVDGLELWIAIKNWITDYCSIYYVDDGAVTSDSELEAWWKEVRHVGHGDHCEAPWWPKLDCVGNLEEICTTIWLGSAFHAAVGLRQYTHLGFVPNRPTIACRAMPEAGAEVTESDFLGSITPRKEALWVMTMTGLSMMTKGEVYLGQRPEWWTCDERAADALARFQSRLEAVVDNINRRNRDPGLRNRAGAVELPYTLLTQTTVPGPVGGGIPNSITN